jgi:hypothetical protein
MEWIKTILPLIGVALGWILSEGGKIFADKRQDKRKLKKLLFFLLELRFYFSKELSNEIEIDKHLVLLENKIVTKFGDPDFNLESNIWKPFIKELILKSSNQDDKFEYLADNIDKILIELAEVFPILAYELDGQHKIKDRINKVDNVLNDVKSMTDFEMPFDIKQWINPKITIELLVDLDRSIKVIAKKIDMKTWQMAKTKIKDMIFKIDVQEFESWIDEYLDKVIENIPENKINN